MNTPTAAGTYTRFMASTFDEEQIIPISSGFQSIFARPGQETTFDPNHELLEYEILRGDETTAKLMLRTGMIGRLLGAEQKNSNIGNYTGVARSYPLSIEEDDVTVEQSLKRIPGEDPYNSNVTKEQRRIFWMMRQHMKQIKRQVKMFELLAAQSLLEGVQDAVIGTTNTDEQYDFYRNAANSITLGTQWTNVSASTPLTDCDDAIKIGRQTGKVTIDYCIQGDDAIKAFIASDQVSGLADNRRYGLIYMDVDTVIPPRFQFLVDGGFQCVGKIVTERGKKLWLFTYDDIYTDDAGDAQNYMADGKVLFGSSSAVTQRAFGPSATFDELPSKQRMYQELFGFGPMGGPMPEVKNGGKVLDPRMFYFDAYTNQDYSTITSRTQTAPIFIPKQTDAWVVIENAA